MKTQTKYIDAEIGAKIRMYRTMKGMNQRELAQKLGFSYQQLQKYEKGQSKIGISTLVIIAESLDVPIIDFCNDAWLIPGKQNNGFDIVNDRAAQRLLRAYTKIKSDDMRSKLAEIAEIIVEVGYVKPN